MLSALRTTELCNMKICMMLHSSEQLLIAAGRAQALEPACWAALLKGRKAVLAGDHLQVGWGPMVGAAFAYTAQHSPCGADIQLSMPGCVVVAQREVCRYGCRPLASRLAIACLPGPAPQPAAAPPPLLIACPPVLATPPAASSNRHQRGGGAQRPEPHAL